MDSQYHQQYESVTSETRIVSMLSQARDIHPGLEIKFSSEQSTLPGKLLGANFASRELIISVPGKGARHIALIKAKTLNVYSETGGADFSFTSRFIKTGEFNGDVCYFIELPTAIKYRQRRSAFRKHISLAQNIMATVKDSEGTTLTGQLRDISSGGMRLQFSEVSTDPFACQAVMPDCTLSLPDKTDISFELRIRHLRLNKRNNGITVGGNFVEMEHQHKRLIERFIADLERKSLREYRT